MTGKVGCLLILSVRGYELIIYKKNSIVDNRKTHVAVSTLEHVQALGCPLDLDLDILHAWLAVNPQSGQYYNPAKNDKIEIDHLIFAFQRGIS